MQNHPLPLMLQNNAGRYGRIETSLLLENGAEYVAIINKKGRIENAIFKNDLPLASVRKEMFCMTLQLQNSMQSEFDDDFGSVEYTMISRKNSKFLLIPAAEGILLAKLGDSTDPLILIREISGTFYSRSSEDKCEVLQ